MVPDSPDRIYDEVTDLAHLTQQMEGWVDSVIAAQLFNIREHCFSIAVIKSSTVWITMPLLLLESLRQRN